MIWFQILQGGYVDLVNPKPEQIDLRHAIRVLCRIPRFGGHTEELYSVGQHTREGVRAVLRETGREDAARAFALHDAHEYVIGDMATPVQEALCAIAFAGAVFSRTGPHRSSVVRDSIKSLKRRLDVAIHARAGVPYPLSQDVSAIVKEFDRRMCAAEHAARMCPLPRPYPYISEAEPLVGCDFYPYRAGTMEELLLAQFEELELLR